MPQILKDRPALPAPATALARGRRAARSPATVAGAEATPRETVTAFLRRTGWATRDRKYGWQFRKRLPTSLEINGEAVTEHENLLMAA